MGMGAAAFLVVEDEPLVARVLARALSPHGRAVVAGSTAAACAALDKHAFSAMVVDVGLPDGSGMAVVARARELDPGMLVLVVSGSVDAARLHDAHAFEVQYLLKPVAPEELALFVERAARRIEHRKLRTAGAVADWTRRYGLGPKEGELLLLAALGKERHELPEARQVAPGTIKSQVRTLLVKTGAPSLEVAVSRVLRAALDEG